MPKTGRPQLIYVIAGKDDSLVGAECSRLIDGLIEPQQRPMGLFSVNGLEAEACDVLDELRTAPFLTSKRVVLVRDADDFISENRQLLEKYFDAPSSTGILVLTVSSWPANTKLARKLADVGKLISVFQPKPSQLPGSLVRYARDAHGRRLLSDAAELLIELAGDDLPRLYSEVDKLVLFAAGEKEITCRQVESLIGHNRTFNAFAVIDAVIDGNAGEAIERLRNMFAVDKSAEFAVIGAFAYHFRRMFRAKVLLEQGSPVGEVAKKLRIWSNTDGFFSQLRRLTLKQIGSVLQRLADMDYAIKTGRTNAKVAVEQLIFKLVSD